MEFFKEEFDRDKSFPGLKMIEQQYSDNNKENIVYKELQVLFEKIYQLENLKWKELVKENFTPFLSLIEKYDQSIKLISDHTNLKSKVQNIFNAWNEFYRIIRQLRCDNYEEQDW